MLTWLDYYVQGTSESARAVGLSGFGGDNVAAMAMLSALNLERLTKHRKRQRIDSDEAVAATLASCVHAMTAHALPDRLAQVQQIGHAVGVEEDFVRKLYTTRAIRPAVDLLETLRDTKAPDTDDWKTPLLSATWYFDIPDKALKVGGECQLRAVFTQPTRWGRIAVVCILTAPGSNKIAGRFAWIWGQDEAVYGLRISGVDPETVRDRLENLLRLLVLYAQVAEKAEFVPLPRTTHRELIGLKPKKRRARLNKSSLFTIRELRSPRNRFGRPVSEASEPTWRLDRAVEVRGHFKWQPYGPKHSRRKLIWIDPYVRGPKDRTPKPVLEILPDDTSGTQP